MTTAQTRKRIKEVLAKHGLTNKFRLETVSFSDLARGEAVFIEIKNWEPCPLATILKEELKPYGIARFSGANIVG